MKPLLIIALSLLATPAFAQDHSMHVARVAADDEAPSSKALMDSHHKMMKDMDITPTGDADADFVAMMIPHHEGAVDMAKIELQYGKDPELRKLAENIVAAQEKEIAFMKEWQTKHAKDKK